LLPEYDHPNYNCIVEDNNGVQRKIYANWLHNNNHDYWQGWDCNAGVTRFYIDKNLEIWDGECKNKLLGNVLENWDPLQHNNCLRERCTGCTDDLMTKKHKVLLGQGK
jgi:hypothetical protein